MSEETQQPTALDGIEAEAARLAAADQAQATEQLASLTETPAEPEKPAFQQPAGAFDMTVDMIVGGIKTGVEGYPGGLEAAKVWEDKMFRQAVIPVLQKYNISVFNLPVELVLLGVILTMAKKTANVINEAKINGQKNSDEVKAD